MKKLLFSLLFAAGLVAPVAANTLVYTIRTGTTTGGTAERTVPLTAGTFLRISGSSTIRVDTAADFKTALSLTKADVGLSNVDNTSDANKPISTATQAALDLKFQRSQFLYGVFTGDYSTGNTAQAAFSRDGIAWSSVALNFSDTTPIANTSVAYKDGRYLMACANVSNIGTSNTAFLFKSSVDGINYTALATVSCSTISGVNRVWAPEIFIDSNGDLYVFFCASTAGSGGPFSIYYVTPTNAAMTTWSAPTAVSGTSLPASWIDPFVVQSGSDYYLFARDTNTDHIISYKSTSSPVSGYVDENTGNAFGFGSATYEAPAITRLDDGTWIMYLDHFAGSLGIYYTTSSDLDSWTAPAAITSSPKLRHGTAINMAAVDYDQLMVTAFASAQSAFNFSVPSNNLLTFEKSASVVGGVIYQFLNKNASNGAYSTLATGEGVSGLNRYVGIEYYNSNLSTIGLLKQNQGRLLVASGGTNGLLVGTDADAPVTIATGGSGTNRARVEFSSSGMTLKNSAPLAFSGTGNPEGVVSAPVGSIVGNTTGATGTSLYLKVSGTGSLGWAPVVTGSLSVSGVASISGSSSGANTGDQTALTLTDAERDFGGAFLLSGFSNGRLETYFQLSPDTQNFTPLFGCTNVYTPPAGYIGDQCITWHGGKWWMVYSNIQPATTSASFGLASATTLGNWTFERNVSTAAVSGVNRTYAPEFYEAPDGTLYIIVGLSTDAGATFRTYRMTVTSSDFLAISDPELIPVTTDPSRYDACIVSHSGTLHMFYRNLTAGTIAHSTSTSISGTFSSPSTVFTGTYEGPSVVQSGSSSWTMIVDATNVAVMRATSSDLSSWSSLAAINTPFYTHHGTQVRLTKQALVNAAFASLGATDKQRWIGTLPTVTMDVATAPRLGVFGSGFQILGGDNTTANTTRVMSIGMMNYNPSLNGLMGIRLLQQTAGNGQLLLGGGTSGGTPVNRIRAFIGSSNANGSGTEVGGFDSDGPYIGTDTIKMPLLPILTSNTTGTITFGTSGRLETIYNSGTTTIASGTMTLPGSGNSRQGQTIRYVTSGEITALTVSGSVAAGTVPSTLAAGSTVSFQSTGSTGVWVRIQ